MHYINNRNIRERYTREKGTCVSNKNLECRFTLSNTGFLKERMQIFMIFYHFFRFISCE